MTDHSIDKFTGLPQLPDGQYWHVREINEYNSESDGRALRVEARKRFPCRERMTAVSKTHYPTVRDALRSRRDEGVYQLPWYSGAVDGTLFRPAGPNLWDDEVELTNVKVTETEVFKPKRLFRKPELDYIEYWYEADALWDRHEVLFHADTSDFSEEGILKAAERAIEDHDRKTAHERFVNRVSGDYPPKKLEIK